MKILLIMDPGISVPPPLYGGHERLVYMFAEEYAKLGHEVTLLAGPDSTCSGKTISFGVNDLQRGKTQKRKELLFVWKFLWAKHSSFDIIHNFGRLLYLLPILNKKCIKIMTYGRPVSRRGIHYLNLLPNKDIVFTACSDYCVSTGNIAGRWETVYNAIEFSKYKLNEQFDTNAPLMFLGRMDRIKGLHTAIQVAKETGHRLLIGGNIPDTLDNLKYFKQELEPQFDGEQIIYLGPLNDIQKNKYLSKAKALLFPIEWDEPFGMVMIEAMACGTPVIAMKHGSVPEVIDEHITGIIVTNKDEMAIAVSEIGNINRRHCRERAKSRFDVSVIAKHYLSIVSRDLF
jgi:glycosyltransferase involved in cell wall biosynthesis